MSAPITFGVVGLDHWYSAIPLAEAIAAHPGAVLAGIADRELSRAREVAAKTGEPRVTADLKELIEDDAVDVIASFASVDQNPDIVVAAAEAGKHIVSVKPLALSLAEADRIRAAVRRSGVVFVPGESRSRGAAQNQWLKEYVSSGRLGRITSAQFSLSGALPVGWPGGPRDGGWWADPERGPGGGWIDHSLYQIDRMRWLLGEEVAEVSGRVANLVHTGLAVEDYGHAIVVFDGGAVASIEDTWSGPAGGWRIATSIVGTAGALTLDTSTGMIGVLESDGAHEGWIQFRSPSDHTVGLEEILAAVREPGKAIGTVDDAWENLSAAIAFYDAAAAGTAVRPAHLRDR